MKLLVMKKWLVIPVLLVSLAACSEVTQEQHAASHKAFADTKNGSSFIGGEEKAPLVTVYKSATCKCCAKWAEHLETAGFTVKTEDQGNMSAIKSELGVPAKLHSCHTAKVGAYVLEGHIPASDIYRLLRQQPDVAGLAVPGMPLGSPGMEHPEPDSYATLTFQDNGETRVFTQHGPNGDTAKDHQAF